METLKEYILDLIDYSTEPYDHLFMIPLLVFLLCEMSKTTARQMFNHGILMQFFTLWATRKTLNGPFIQEVKKQTSSGFDILIFLEKDANVNHGVC